MKRHAEFNLIEWYNDSNRMPLIIRGARQVGKSTLVKNFCKETEIQLIEVNLEKNKVPAFELEDFDIDRVLSDIESIAKKEINPSKKQLLFIDEIQVQPKALRSLRYFFEERPDIPVVAAGSLLDFLLNDKKLDFPVGRVSYLKLGPMCFSEFLMAIDEDLLLKKITQFKLLKGKTHDELLKLYRLYMFVGGMPKAIVTFKNTRKLSAVRRIQKDLIQTYKDDFIKYTKTENTHSLVNTVFDFIPYNLGRKIKYSEINPDCKAQTLKNAIELLRYARILIPVYHSNSTGLPISSQKDTKIFKLYFLDIGLVSAATDISIEDIDKKSLLEGPLAEQFVAQHLNYYFNTQIHEDLFYWMKDKSTSKAEVDFVLQKRKQIIPLEVKSGSLFKMKSLHQFCAEKKSNLGIILSEKPYEFSTYKFQTYDGSKTVSHSANLLQLPIYAVEYLNLHLTPIED